jgi:hypothetical protein
MNWNVLNRERISGRAMMANEHWYVLKVRSGFEVVVAQRLRKLGLEAFVPERDRVPSEESHDRSSQSVGYVYCRFALERRRSLTSIPGVLDILGTPNPTPCDSDVSALRTASSS